MFFFYMVEKGGRGLTWVGDWVTSVDGRLLIDIHIARLDDLPHARDAVPVQQLELARRPV
jgi:hypothetical protein